MKIDSLKLINFRCFDESHIDLHPNFNIFIGDNATGKTSILEALTAGIGAFFIGIEGISARNIQQDDIRLKFFEHGGIINYEHQIPVTLRCRGSSDGRPFDWTLTRRYPKGQTDRRSAKDLTDYSEFLGKEVRSGEEVVLPLIAYYGTGRLWRSKKDAGYSDQRGSRFEGYKNCLTASSDVRMFKGWWKEHEMISLQEKDTLQLKAVKKAVLSVIPDAENIRYDFNCKDLIISFSNGEICPFHSLSDGYRGMLAMVADIAVRAATLNPFFEDNALAETPGIVLVDELDLHLHPKWQRRIVNDLRSVFPKIQFVTTTHAQQILVGAKAGEISRLRKDDETQTIHISPHDIPPGLRADQVLTGEWFGLPSTLDPDTLELLEQHRILLRKSELSDEEEGRRTEIENELRNRLGRYADTSLERMALGIVAELTDQEKPLSVEERKSIRERVLSKICQNGKEEK